MFNSAQVLSRLRSLLSSMKERAKVTKTRGKDQRQKQTNRYAAMYQPCRFQMLENLDAQSSNSCLRASSLWDWTVAQGWAAPVVSGLGTWLWYNESYFQAESLLLRHLWRPDRGRRRSYSCLRMPILESLMALATSSASSTSPKSWGRHELGPGMHFHVRVLVSNWCWYSFPLR